MARTPKTKFDKIIKAIAAEKTKIQAARDRLRDIVEDAEAVLESCDDAVICLDGAKDYLREVESATDSLSQYL